MREVFCWLMYCCPQEHRFELQINNRMEGPFRSGGLPKSLNSPLQWHNLEVCFRSLAQAMVEELLNDRWSKCGGINFCNMLIHETYLNSTMSKKGVGPAKMTPQIENLNMSDLGFFPAYV